jgi:hypothetical protein
MAPLTKNLSRGAGRAKELPLETILTVGMTIAREARKRWDGLTPSEQRRLKTLLTKSKGVPASLSAKERSDLRRIVLKAAGF